jgi:hypothetical protein
MKERAMMTSKTSALLIAVGTFLCCALFEAVLTVVLMKTQKKCPYMDYVEKNYTKVKA